MKILSVIGSVDRRGGGTTDHVFACCELWSRAGHEAHILSLDPPLAECVSRSPVRTFALGTDSKLSESGRRIPLIRYGYTPGLVKWLKQHCHSYDAVILNGLWNYTSYGSWRALKNMGVPYYVCPHGMLDPWLRTARPTAHWARVAFWNLFEHRVIRDAAGIFFACDEERRLADAAFLHGIGRAYVVPYGARDIQGDPQVQREAFLERFPELRGRRLILFLGRIHQKKGLDLLISAFAETARQSKEYDLLIVGPDDEGLTSALNQLVENAAISDRVHWTGMLVGNQKWGAFRASEFLALPSHQENFGIAVVEAMAMSLPVLITNKVNIWREIESSGSGYAVPDTVEGISDGLRRMSKQGVDQRQFMGARGRACYLENFNLTKNAMEFIRIMSPADGDGRRTKGSVSGLKERNLGNGLRA